MKSGLNLMKLQTGAKIEVFWSGSNFQNPVDHKPVSVSGLYTYLLTLALA